MAVSEEMKKRYAEVSLVKTSYGFYQVSPMPSEEELQEYYRETYFQQAAPGKSVYSQEYDEDERYFTQSKLQQKLIMIQEDRPRGKGDTFLDLGCGEGFAMQFFHDQGYKVEGVDFSRYAMEHHNPNMLPFLRQGDLLSICDEMIQEGRQFGVVHISNLLEHVRSPEDVLTRCAALMEADGLLIIRVPNDFNPLQKFLLDHQMIHTKKWIVPPEHLSYFNMESLVNVCEAFGLQKQALYGDQFIEFFAFHEDNNYYDEPEKGHKCHVARLALEKFLHEVSPTKLLALGKAMADMGLGRDIIGVFKKK